jgi:hypothetical protein
VQIPTAERTRIDLRLDEHPAVLEHVGERRISELVELFTGRLETLSAARLIQLWKHFHHVLPRWDRLSFHMQHQQQSNWCWAAVSTSVSHYYDPTSTWTQCLVANGELNRTDCCGGGASGACNVYGFLNSALQRVGHLDHMDGSAISFGATRGEIAADRPVGIRVAWAGGGAHFLAIVGVLDATQDWVAVDDPIYGASDLTYTALKTAYQTPGSTWTHTYYTEA